MFRGVRAQHDPRFKAKTEKITLPETVSDSITTDGVTSSAFEPWVSSEIAKYTDDDFVGDLVMGFIRSKVIDSQEMAQTLQPALGEHTGTFVAALWDLLKDAKASDLGIPRVFLEQAQREMEERLKNASEARKKLTDSSSSDSDSDRKRHKRRDSDSDERPRKRRHSSDSDSDSDRKRHRRLRRSDSDSDSDGRRRRHRHRHRRRH